jgi:hypothetical protein
VVITAGRRWPAVDRVRVIERMTKVKVVELEPGLTIDWDLLADLCYSPLPYGVGITDPELQRQLTERGYISDLPGYSAATEKLEAIAQEVGII